MSGSSGSSEEQRYSQARSLASMRPPALYQAAEALFADPAWRVRRAAWEALLQAEGDLDEKLAFLLQRLENEDDAGTRGAALEAFIATGARAVPFLVAALPARQPRFQRYILDVLAQLRAPEAADAALALLTSPDENVSFAAAEVVGVSGTDAHAAPLLSRTKEVNQVRRFSLLAALVQIARRVSVRISPTELTPFLSDSLLRGPAIELLGHAEEAAAGETLWAQLDVERPADVTILALERLRRRGFLELPDDPAKMAALVNRACAPGASTEVRRAVFDLLAGIAGAPLAPLLPRLAETDREWLTQRLAELNDARLRDLLQDVAVNEQGRITAASVYRLRPQLRGEAPLLALLNQPGAHRGEAIAALAEVGTLRCAPHLISLCGDSDEGVAAQASEALVHLAKRGIEGLEEAVFKTIADKPPSVVVHLLPVTGWFCESERARDFLCASMRDFDPAVRRAAAASAAMMTPHADVEHLLVRCLADESEEVRTAAAEVCGRARVTAAQAALGVLVDDPSPWVASAALGALAQMGLPPKGEKLEALLRGGGIVSVAAANCVAVIPVDDETFVRFAGLLTEVEDEPAAELLKGLARWPQEVPRQSLEALHRHPSWSVRAALVQYLEAKRPAWLSEMGRPWLESEDDAWVRLRLEELVGA